MPTTIKEIAREAGVSIATVSRAINGKAGVGPETCEKILEIAKRLNYHPNLQARGLVAKKPDSIGIVIPRTADFIFSNPFFAEILKGVAKRVKASGRYLVFSFSVEEDYTLMYHHRLAAGIVVMGHRINDPGVEEAWKMKVPTILIPGDPQHPGVPSVDFDNVNGAFQAVDYLIRLGHQRIAFINGPMNSKFSVERLIGYQTALRKHHFLYQKDLVWESDFTQQGGYEGTKQLLSLTPSPTALLVINDYSAMGVLRAAKESGYRVPVDISVVGFGDVPFASMMDPPLTTIREPFQKVGEDAADMLFKIIRGKKLSRKHRILPVNLVIRESTAPPPKKRVKV